MSETEWPEQDFDDRTRLGERSRSSLDGEEDAGGIDDRTRLSKRGRRPTGGQEPHQDFDDRTRLSERATLHHSPFDEGQPAGDYTEFPADSVDSAPERVDADVRYMAPEGYGGRVSGSGLAEVVYNPEIDGVQVTSYTPRGTDNVDIVLDEYGGTTDATLLSAQAAHDELVTHTRQSLARRYERGTTVRLWVTAAVGSAVAIGSAVAATILATGF